MLLIKLTNACVTVSLRVAIFNLQRIDLGGIDNIIHEHDDIYINITKFRTINILFLVNKFTLHGKNSFYDGELFALG